MDFFRQVEIDWRTGDLLFDREGKTRWLENGECFDQALHNIGYTQRGEDMLDQNMGFGRMEILLNEYDEDQVALADLETKRAFGTATDDRIHSIDSLAVWKEDRDIKIDAIVKSVNSTVSNIGMALRL